MKNRLMVICTLAIAAAAFAQDEKYTPPTFTFDTSTEGWTAGAAPGVFDVPTFSHEKNSLAVQATSNTNCFGFWESPITEIPLLTKGTIPAFYLASYSVAIDGEFPANSPNFRFRATRPDFSEAAVMSVESVGDHAFSPKAYDVASPLKGLVPPEYGRYYYQFFDQYDFNRNMRFSFDLLNFSGLDAPSANLLLESANVFYYVPSAPFSVDHVYDFTSSQTRGFSFSSPPGVQAPFAFSTDDGLLLQPQLILLKGEAPSLIFGSWELASNIKLRAGYLHRITFRVRSSTPSAQRTEVPTFRCRVNDSTLQGSWYLNIDSTTSGARIPNNDVAVDYRLFIWAPTELNERTMIFSFDSLWVPGDGNSPFRSVILESLTVESLDYGACRGVIPETRYLPMNTVTRARPTAE